MAERRPVVGLYCGGGSGSCRPGALLLGEDAELLRRVCEEADAAAAGGAVFAWLSPVPRRVEPALENPVSELARVASLAAPLAKLRARRARVVELPRVTPSGLLARVRVWALGPVV